MHTLKITDLHVTVEDKEILNGFDIEIHSGEIHAIMGPNGTGKSTLTNVIMGNPNYKITKGEITYDGVSLNEMKVDERARLGIFLGMQLPLEIEGVSNADFLRNAIHVKEGNNFKLLSFVKEMNQDLEKLSMDKDMIHRSLNQGFSGGEKKKNEILQMMLLKPSLVMLDEIDSGLDVDSLKIVGTQVMEYYHKEKPAILLITHYQRLLDYIKPDFVHILKDGHIVESGDAQLVSKIEKHGYTEIDSKKSSQTGACIMKEMSRHE